MRRAVHLLLIVLLCVASIPFALAQTPQAGINPRGVVDSAEISGIDENEIGRDIRDSVRRMVGQPFDQQTADGLVARLQNEKAEFTATVRLLASEQPDHVKVIFYLEKIGDQPAGEGNVNSRYTVERVEIQGFDEAKLSVPLREELRKLVGEKLDQDKATEVLHRLGDELRPRHSVTKRVEKGSERQLVVLIFEVRNVRWIPFVAQPPDHVLYHSKENFSAIVSADIIDKSNAKFFLGGVNDQDQLLERFAGFNAGLQTRSIGTERLGFDLRYARYHERWQPATIAAARDSIYRERFTFDPSLTFAFDPRVRLTAGVSLSDLQLQYPSIHRANANAVVGTLSFQNTWGRTGIRSHSLTGSYDFRAGNHNLDSEFIYSRHLVQTQYTYRAKENQFLVRFSAGDIRGNAPLYERFSLGNSETLRGWNKFDLAPAGGNRMMHGTLQYRFGGPGVAKIHIQTDPPRKADFGIELGFHLFYDAGVVGDRGSPMKARHSVGFGFGVSDFFFDFGFPIRSSNWGPVFMTGFRF